MRVQATMLGVLVIAVACGGGAGEKATDTTAMAAAAAPAPVDAGAVRAAIEAANAKGIEAFNAGDVGPMLANYEDEAVILFPGAPAMRGKAAWDAALRDMMKQNEFKDMKFHTDDVIAAGDYAIETGSFSWMTGPKGKKLTADSGKYVTVWHKQGDGSWKIVRDINNSDIPPK